MRPRCRPPPCAPTDCPWSELDEMEAVPLAPGLPPGVAGGDLIAGLTVWAVLVPEALAYATIAGVSPVVGLYAAPGALILYAAFGSSRHLVVGPMSATAALSAAAVAEFASRARAVRDADGGAGRHRGIVGGRSRPLAPRLRRKLHLRARVEGVHRRPRADDHGRAGAEAVRGREGRRKLLREDLGPDRASSATRGGRRWPSGCCRSRSCSAPAARRWCRRPWSPSRVGVLAVTCSTSTTTVCDRRSHRRRASVVGLPDVAALRLARDRRRALSASC